LAVRLLRKRQSDEKSTLSHGRAFQFGVIFDIDTSLPSDRWRQSRRKDAAEENEMDEIEYKMRLRDRNCKRSMRCGRVRRTVLLQIGA